MLTSMMAENGRDGVERKYATVFHEERWNRPGKRKHATVLYE